MSRGDDLTAELQDRNRRMDVPGLDQLTTGQAPCTGTHESFPYPYDGVPVSSSEQVLSESGVIRVIGPTQTVGEPEPMGSRRSAKTPRQAPARERRNPGGPGWARPVASTRSTLREPNFTRKFRASHDRRSPRRREPRGAAGAVLHRSRDSMLVPSLLLNGTPEGPRSRSELQVLNSSSLAWTCVLYLHVQHYRGCKKLSPRYVTVQY